MIHYYLQTKEGYKLAKELDTLSACAVLNKGFVADMSEQGDDFLVEVNSVEFNIETKTFNNNLENEYQIIRSAASCRLEPKGVTENLLEYCKSKLQTIKRDIDILDQGALNASTPEEMNHWNDKYLTEKRVLNLVHALSKANLYIHPDNS